MAASSSRTSRYPIGAFTALLAARPFPARLWESATSERLHLRIGNAAPALTKADALLALRDFLEGTETFNCAFCEFWARKEVIYVETELVACGSRTPNLVIPCVIVARTTHGVLDDLRFYVDRSRPEE